MPRRAAVLAATHRTADVGVAPRSAAVGGARRLMGSVGGAWLTGLVAAVLACTSCANLEAPSHAASMQVPGEGHRPTGPAPGSLDALAVATAHSWAFAHDARDGKRLEALYATHVRFERFDLSREVVLRVKAAEFSRSPSARRTITNVHVELDVPGLPAVVFRTTHVATNRIRTEETRLVLSCDRRGVRDCEGVPCATSEPPSCVVVEEEDSSFVASLARAKALSERPGSCPEAIVALAASTRDAREILGNRPMATSAIPLFMPPESLRYGIVLLDAEGAPKALYEVDPTTLDMTETLPGDVPQVGDSARKERAKRVCQSL